MKKENRLERLEYHNPGLQADLAIGTWATPMPMDYYGDGDYDILVVCKDMLYNGTYFFENGSGKMSRQTAFSATMLLEKEIKNLQFSYIDNIPRILESGIEYTGFIDSFFTNPNSLYKDFHVDPRLKKIRANQWKYVDYESDSDLDLLVEQSDWEEYSWDNVCDRNAILKNSPLYGYIYLVENNRAFQYLESLRLQSNEKEVNVYGMPVPNMHDFDNDGNFDLLVNGKNIVWNENTGENKVITTFKFQGDWVDVKLTGYTTCPTTIRWDKVGIANLLNGAEDGHFYYL